MKESTDIYSFHRTNQKKSADNKWRLNRINLESLQRRLFHLVAWETAFIALFCFLLGRAVVLGATIPFAVAAMAAVMLIIPDRGLLAFLFLVGGLATVLHGPLLWSSVALLALCLLTLSKFSSLLKNKWFGLPLLILGLTTVARVGFYAYTQPALYNYMVAAFEGLVAAGITSVFIRVLPALRRQADPFALRRDELMGLAVLIIGLLTGLSEVRLAGIDLRNVVSKFFILSAAFTGGASLGAAMGTLVGMVPSLSATLPPGIIGFYSFAGLMAGLFRGFGRIGIIIGFSLGNIILSIYLNSYRALAVDLAETALAAAAFLVIPKKVIYYLRSLIRGSMAQFAPRSFTEKRLREMTSARVREFARVFQELSRTIEQVACDTRAREDNSLQMLFSNISNKVCKGCSLHRICWEKDFYKTYKSIMELFTTIEATGRVSAEHIGPDIQKRCVRLKELAVTVNCLFDLYKANHFWERKVAESREVVAGQLEGISGILYNLAGEIKVDVQMREDIELILRRELIKGGYSVLDLKVLSIGNDKIEVVISSSSCGGKLQCSRAIGPLVAGVLGQRMKVLNANYCPKKTGDPTCEFRLYPAFNLRVEIGVAGAACDPEISGDSYSFLELRDGKYVLMLSDGMGIGAKAAQESKATIGLLEQLMETGFDKALAIKTVNSILVVRAPEETFASADLTVIDLFSGSADFMKIGAAPSFIKRGNQVGIIRSASLPIGILNNIEVDCIQKSLTHDDVVVMVTDGILDAGREEGGSDEWVLDTLQLVMTTDPQNIADLLLNKAIARNGGAVADDMTVLVVALKAVSE